MVFNDTNQKQGLIQDCEQRIFGNYGDISNNPNRFYDFTARMNRALDKVAALAMSVDGRWQFDDINYTDFPIGSTNIVSGQADYTLSTTHLVIEKVIIHDSSGNTIILKPIDIQDPIAAVYLQQPLVPTTGQPVFYDKQGSSVILYPTPNYNYTNGLTVYFKRGPSYFACTDTTKTPGIASIFHPLISLSAAFDYAVDKVLSSKNDLAVRVKEMEDMIMEHYQKRSKDEAKFIRPIIHSSR